MLKRVVLVSLALVMVLSMVSIASARFDIADYSKKGSLLVFPKIAVLPPDLPYADAVDTYIFIGNDSSMPTYVKCYWMDQNQSIEDFMFYLTANQPIVFSAREGAQGVGPAFSSDAVGSLVCWAQDAKDQNPIKFNHLYGYAMIKEANGANVFYNATSFALPGNPPAYVEGSDTVEMKLSGEMYDMCPKYLIANFVTGWNTARDPSPLPAVKPDLTLWPCKQDLRQDRIPTCTKAKFDVWNAHEVKFTGSYKCFKCFFEGFLHEIDQPRGGWDPIGKKATIYGKGPGFGGEKFTGEVLRTATARMRVQGIRSSVCDPIVAGTTVTARTLGCGGNYSVNSPLLGVLLYGDILETVPASPTSISPRGGYNMTGAGYDPSGFIKWNPSQSVEKKAR